MKLLDKAADWIREVLAFLPPRVVAYVWLPVLVVVVFIAAMLSTRRLLPLLGRLGATLLRALAALVGAVLLAPDMIIATVFRRVGRRPPAVLYHYGDIVAASVIGLAGTSGAVASALARVARIHASLVILGCTALIWTWNHDHCPATPATTACVRPFTSWVDAFDDDQPASPAPKITPRSSPSPKKK